MRPCNQCRKPVDNSVFICEKCKAYNEEHGIEAPKSIKAFSGSAGPPSTSPESATSLIHMGLAFQGIVSLLCGLFCYLVFDWTGFLVGALLGIIVGFTTLRLIIG